jgi:hypothetical protein
MSYANATNPASAKRRARPRVVVDSGATVHDENAWPLASTVRIDGKKPVESYVAVSVDDLFGLLSHLTSLRRICSIANENTKRTSWRVLGLRATAR